MEARVYFAGMRNKILKDFLSVQIFQTDVFVLHMHILATMELKAKEPFGPPRIVFQCWVQYPINPWGKLPIRYWVMNYFGKWGILGPDNTLKKSSRLSETAM